MNIFAPTPDFNDIFSYGFSKGLYKIPITGIKIGEESNDIFYNLISESITPEMLQSGNLNGIFTMVAGNLQSSTFVTGVRGWRISSSGDAEFATGTFRGYVKGGQTDYNTGTGFFLGLSGGAYKLSIGNPSGDYLTWDGSTLSISGYTPMATNFGDGSDGDVTIGSNTSLSADMYYNDLTINTGIVLSTAGYRIYCTGTLTNNGTIRNNGGNASGQTGGTAGAGITVRGGGAGGNGSGTIGVSGGGGGGGGGGGTIFISAQVINTSSGTIQANGGNGGIGNWLAGGDSNGSPGTAIDCSKGGSGGAGGDYPGGGGGAVGGTATATNQTFKYYFLGANVFDFVTAKGIGGGGGGGGGGSSDPGAGGGGGGGGGHVLLYYKTTSWGTEQANGGSPGAADPQGGSPGTAGSAGTVTKVALI